MKRTILSFFLLSMLLLPFTSCKDSESTVEKDNKYVNNWIYNRMSFYYYWSDKIPYRSDYTQSPDNFFKSLIYPYNSSTHEGDRFSWIQESYVDLINALNGVTSSDVGFEYYTGGQPGTGSKDLGYTVVYVKRNTDASTKLKRGDFITAVDGTAITDNNYTALLRSGKSAYTLTVIDGVTGVSSTKTINVERNYAEYPIQYSKVFAPTNAKTVGYLVYNFFASDKGDSSWQYDTDLANLLEDFKTKGVSDLVLDLRYNGGGSVESAVYLASALVNRSVSDRTFARNDFNQTYGDALQKKYGDDIFTYQLADNVQSFDANSNPVNHATISELGKQLNSVYILTGNYTASASELIINGLRAYLGNKVKLIGGTTYGKNVGSITLYEENDNRNKWGMQPIVLKISNKDGFSSYEAGFTPGSTLIGGVKMNEFDYALQPFGDESEPLLAEALAQITGIRRTSVKKTTSISPRIIGSSLDNKAGAYQMFVDDKRFSVDVPDNHVLVE